VQMLIMFGKPSVAIKRRPPCWASGRGVGVFSPLGLNPVAYARPTRRGGGREVVRLWEMESRPAQVTRYICASGDRIPLLFVSS